jgi:hypothetical protein
MTEHIDEVPAENYKEVDASIMTCFGMVFPHLVMESRDQLSTQYETTLPSAVHSSLALTPLFDDELDVDPNFDE